MPTEKKVNKVEELTSLLSRNKFIIATEYRGLSVSEMSQLRKQLREADTEYHVVKNNLAKFAARNTGKEGLSQFLQGPIALAFCDGDAVQLARAITAYARASKNTFVVKGGVLDFKVLSASEISYLSTMPPVEVLRAKLMGVLQSPIYLLHNVLSANIRALGMILQARIQQMGGTANV